jgi:ketosteroid isomerase-like protein
MSTGELRRQVAAAYEAWDAAFNRGDAQALAAFYLPGAMFLPATHAVLSGPAEIEPFFASLFANGLTGHALSILEVGGDGKLVYGAARWTATAKDTDGAPQTSSGIATHIFERQANGGLKLKLHTFN